MPTRLGSVAARISQGIRTSANEIYVLEVVERGDGEVRAKSEQLDKEVVLEDEGIYAFLEGEEIKPFIIHPGKKVVIMPYKIQGGTATLLPLRDLPQKVRNYFRANESALRAREDCRFDGPDWHQFGRNQNIDLMLLPKLLVPDIAANASFALDEGGDYAFTSGYGITLMPDPGLSLKFLLGLCNSRVLDFFWRKVSTPLRGGFYRYFTQHIEQFPIPASTPKQRGQVERVADWLVWLHRQPSVAESTREYPRDPLIAAYFEQWLNALVYELYFPAELHAAGLHFFTLTAQHTLPAVESVPSAQRLSRIRELFETLYDINHPLRAALFGLGSLETVRIIEGKE